MRLARCTTRANVTFGHRCQFSGPRARQCPETCAARESFLNVVQNGTCSCCCARGFPVLNTEGPLCDCKFDESNPTERYGGESQQNAINVFGKASLSEDKQQCSWNIRACCKLWTTMCRPELFWLQLYASKYLVTSAQKSTRHVREGRKGWGSRQAEGRSSSLFEQNAPLHLLQHYLFRICLFHSGAPR